MATENLYATSLTSGAVATSANALGAPDGTFTTDVDNSSWTARFALGNPTNPTPTGSHTITLRVRKETGTGTPAVTSCRLYAGATDLGLISSGSTNVTSTTGVDVTYTFSSSLLSGVDLSTIDVEIVTTASGGSPSARSCIQLDGITWSGNFNPAPNAGTSSGSFDFTGSSAGNRPPKGTTTGGFALAGSSAGSRVAQGSASGAYDFTGTTAGEVPPNVGTAGGTFDFTGSGAGDMPPLDGTATGGFDFTGSATGVARNTSDWSDSASATTGAAGANAGVATGSYSFAGVSRLGSRESTGSASGTFLFAGTAAGEAPANEGIASGSWSFDGSAYGSAPPGEGTADSTTGWYGFATGSAPEVVMHEGTASGTYSFSLVLATAQRESRGLGLGWFTFAGTVDGIGVDPTYTFEPPTFHKAVVPPPLVKRPRIGLTEAISVVRVNGTLTPIKTPTDDQLEAAGVEGEDYFLGGHVYTAVPQAVGLELQAAGYTVTEN